MSNTMQHIRKIRSPDNQTALQAIEGLRARGWLGSDALSGAYLRYVHLQGADLHRAKLNGADLYTADLRGADLSMADLQNAKLCRANLSKADLSMANLTNTDLHKANLNRARNVNYEHLAQAQRLRGATMPDGSLYDGRLNLASDIVFAQNGGIDAENAQEMADFYGVPLEEYQHGQNWARRHATVIQIPEREFERDVIRRELRKAA